MKEKLILLSILFLLCLVSVARSQSENKDSKSQQNDKPLKIKKKPSVRFNPTDCEAATGRNRFKVTFDKSGKITNAEIILSSDCKIFDENSMIAAQKITFSPALKDGQPVTSVKIVEYEFRNY